MFFRMLLVWLCALFIGKAFANTVLQPKMIYGYLERASLPDKALTLKAKLDTGAKSASLHAVHIHYITLDDKPYVSFVVPTKKGDVLFTYPHVGDVSIKARSGEVAGVRIKSPFIRRPVVMMPIRLGQATQTIRVNLANRKRFRYPLLLGREALIAFNGMVDPAKKFTINDEYAVIK